MIPLETIDFQKKTKYNKKYSQELTDIVAQW